MERLEGMYYVLKYYNCDSCMGVYMAIYSATMFVSSIYE